MHYSLLGTEGLAIGGYSNGLAADRSLRETKVQVGLQASPGGLVGSLLQSCEPPCNMSCRAIPPTMLVSLARQAELMLRRVPQMESENQQLRGDLSTMPFRTLFCGGNLLQIE